MNREEVFLSNPLPNALDPNADPYGSLERLGAESFGKFPPGINLNDTFCTTIYSGGIAIFLSL